MIKNHIFSCSLSILLTIANGAASMEPEKQPMSAEDAAALFANNWQKNKELSLLPNEKAEINLVLEALKRLTNSSISLDSIQIFVNVASALVQYVEPDSPDSKAISLLCSRLIHLLKLMSIVPAEEPNFKIYTLSKTNFCFALIMQNKETIIPVIINNNSTDPVILPLRYNAEYQLAVLFLQRDLIMPSGLYIRYHGYGKAHVYFYTGEDHSSIRFALSEPREIRTAYMNATPFTKFISFDRPITDLSTALELAQEILAKSDWYLK